MGVASLLIQFLFFVHVSISIIPFRTPFPSDADPLSHAAGFSLVLKPEGLEGDYGAAAKPDISPGQVKLGQQVVIEFVLVQMNQPHRQHDIGLIAHRVKSHTPAQPPIALWLATRRNQADDNLIFDSQKLRIQITRQRTIKFGNWRLRSGDDLTMHPAQALGKRDAFQVMV